MLNLFIDTIERIRKSHPAKQKEFIDSSPNSILVTLLTDIRSAMDETMNEFVQQKKNIAIPSIGAFSVITNRQKVLTEIDNLLDKYGVEDVAELSDDDKDKFDKELYTIKADIVEASKKKNDILTIKL